MNQRRTVILYLIGVIVALLVIWGVQNRTATPTVTSVPVSDDVRLRGRLNVLLSTVDVVGVTIQRGDGVSLVSVFYETATSGSGAIEAERVTLLQVVAQAMDEIGIVADGIQLLDMQRTDSVIALLSDVEAFAADRLSRAAFVGRWRVVAP